MLVEDQSKKELGVVLFFMCLISETCKENTQTKRIWLQ